MPTSRGILFPHQLNLMDIENCKDLGYTSLKFYLQKICAFFPKKVFTLSLQKYNWCYCLLL